MKKLIVLAALTAVASIAQTKEAKPPAPAPEVKQLDTAQKYAVEQALAAAQAAQKVLSDVVKSVEKQCGGNVQPSGNDIVCVVQTKAPEKK